MSKPTVLLGMSGGVDSSVAALLLREQGYRVQGVTLQVWENEDDKAAVTKKWEERGCCKVGLARHVAKRLDMPHDVVDTRETFRTNVVEDFIAGYTGGTTPNPCVRCNERVKFGVLYRLAQDRGADFVATGHYARVLPIKPLLRHSCERRNPGFGGALEEEPPSVIPANAGIQGLGGVLEEEPPSVIPANAGIQGLGGALEEGVGLFKGTDATKDQSYFLHRIAAAWLPRILFPVGHLHKAEVWRRAAELDLPADEMKESQEICFVTQGNYRKFLTVEAPHAHRPGPFVDAENRIMGEHRGIAFYTPGQRKGLGLACGERLYVQEVCPDTNTVVLGRAEDLLRRTCTVHTVNWLADEWPSSSQRADIKYRYASPAVPGQVRRQTSGTFLVEFQEAQSALSPGQSLVLYHGDRVLGGGFIERFPPRHRSKTFPATSRRAARATTDTDHRRDPPAG